MKLGYFLFYLVTLLGKPAKTNLVIFSLQIGLIKAKIV